ncbi:ISAs1 family transposase [Nonomuraea deserti]|uniref:ISAs1 family transposase n=1 Tax=Nonomuraea deserti TaxID=1848322 RepID=A0A4R4VDA6_9ACTN|nr:ISAs1 family transposase [Nonomuraea deserti]
MIVGCPSQSIKNGGRVRVPSPRSTCSSATWSTSPPSIHYQTCPRWLKFRMPSSTRAAAADGRYRLGPLLALSLLAVLGGGDLFGEVTRFIAGYDLELRARLGLPDTVRLAGSALIRLLARPDGDAFDAATCAYLAALADCAPSAISADARAPLFGLAVDGKTLRGSRTGQSMTHLLAATRRHPQIVVAQHQVLATSNEIPIFRPLLSDLDLTDAVITTDALHTQHEHARQIVDAGGHYMFIVKGSQPTLLRRLKAQPWREAIRPLRATGSDRLLRGCASPSLRVADRRADLGAGRERVRVTAPGRPSSACRLTRGRARSTTACYRYAWPPRLAIILHTLYKPSQAFPTCWVHPSGSRGPSPVQPSFLTTSALAMSPISRPEVSGSDPATKVTVPSTSPLDRSITSRRSSGSRSVLRAMAMPLRPSASLASFTIRAPGNAAIMRMAAARTAGGVGAFMSMSSPISHSMSCSEYCLPSERPEPAAF